jgi:periplasmic mercuric ion binding protein
MKNLLFVVFALFLGTNISAQKKADVTFEVGGVCGMCEERIERAYDVKGIVIADYDLESHTLHVVYNTKHFPDILDVHRLATGVGHDTDLMKASDEVYAKIHGCCKYRVETETHKCSGDHER